MPITTLISTSAIDPQAQAQARQERRVGAVYTVVTVLLCALIVSTALLVGAVYTVVTVLVCALIVSTVLLVGGSRSSDPNDSDNLDEEATSRPSGLRSQDPSQQPSFVDESLFLDLGELTEGRKSQPYESSEVLSTAPIYA